MIVFETTIPSRKRNLGVYHFFNGGANSYTTPTFVEP
jgi:hypothetical protein